MIGLLTAKDFGSRSARTARIEISDNGPEYIKAKESRSARTARIEILQV